MKMKKFLALLTSAAMAASMTAVVASAEEGSADVPAEQRIEATSGLMCRFKNTDGSITWNAGQNNTNFVTIGSTAAETNNPKEIQFYKTSDTDETGFCAIYRFDISQLDGYKTATLKITSTVNQGKTLSVYTYTDAELPITPDNTKAKDMYDAVIAKKGTAALGEATLDKSNITVSLNVEDLKNANTDDDNIISLLITSFGPNSSNPKHEQAKINVDGPDRPYLYTEAPAAKLTDSNGAFAYYNSLAEALTAAKSLETASIEVYKEQTLTERCILKTNDANSNLKTLTVTGVGSEKIAINAPQNQTLTFEANSGTTLTLNNVTVNSGKNCAVSIKSGSHLTLDNVTVNTMDVSGANTGTNISNSIIDGINIKSNASSFKLGSGNTLKGTIKLDYDTASNGFPSSIFTVTDGATVTLNNCTLTDNGGNTITDHTLDANGTITAAQPENNITAAVTKVEGFYGTDADGNDVTTDTATAITTTFSGTGSCKLNDYRWTVDSTTYKIDTDKEVSVTLNGTNSSAVYGLVIKNIYKTQTTDVSVSTTASSN